jgi:hypothetical protein
MFMAAVVPLLQLAPAAPASADALQLTTYRDGPDEFEVDIPEGLRVHVAVLWGQLLRRSTATCLNVAPLHLPEC